MNPNYKWQGPGTSIWTPPFALLGTALIYSWLTLFRKIGTRIRKWEYKLSAIGDDHFRLLKRGLQHRQQAMTALQ